MIRNALPVLLAAVALWSSPQAISQATPPPFASGSTSVPAEGSAPVPAPAPAAVAESPQREFRVPVGWRVKMLRGEEPRYCRTDVRLGSRFAKEECLTRDQLALRLQLEADNASRVSQGARICSSAPGCANN